MKRIIALLVILLTFTDYALSAVLFGLSFDTSSNMLMRPESQSGTITNFYSKTNIFYGKFNLSYLLDAGIVEKYRGIQYLYNMRDRKKASFLGNNYKISILVLKV